MPVQASVVIAPASRAGLQSSAVFAASAPASAAPGPVVVQPPPAAVPVVMDASVAAFAAADAVLTLPHVVAFATPPLSVDASVAASAAANAVHALPASVALATLPSNMDAAVTVAANPAMLPPRRDASAIAVIPALPSATPALAAAARALAHTVPAPTSAVRAITPTATPNIPPRDALPVARSSAHRSRSRTSTNKAWRCLSVVSAILFALYCGAAWHQSCFPANLPCPSPARADTCGCSLCTTVGPRQLGGTQAVHASAVACPADILHATMDRALDSMPCSKAFTHHMLQWWGVPQHRGTVARQEHFRVYLVDTGIALLRGHEA